MLSSFSQRLNTLLPSLFPFSLADITLHRVSLMKTHTSLQTSDVKTNTKRHRSQKLRRQYYQSRNLKTITTHTQNNSKAFVFVKSRIFSFFSEFLLMFAPLQAL